MEHVYTSIEAKRILSNPHLFQTLTTFCDEMQNGVVIHIQTYGIHNI